MLSNIDKGKPMHIRINEFLEKKTISHWKQFGFWKDFSTNHAILDLTQSMQKALDDGLVEFWIFIDFGKALNYYDIRGITNDWIGSDPF